MYSLSSDPEDLPDLEEVEVIKDALLKFDVPDIMVYQKNLCVRMLDRFSSLWEKYDGCAKEEVYAAIIAYDEAFDKLKSDFLLYEQNVKRKAKRTQHRQEKLELLRRRNAILEAQFAARVSLSGTRKRYQVKFDEQIAVLSDQIAELEYQCAKSQMKTIELKEQVRDMECLENVFNDQIKTTRDECDDHNVILQKRVTALEKQCAAHETETITLKQEMTRLQTCINALHGTVAFHDAETAIVKTGCSNLQDQHDELQERVITLEDRTDLLKDEHVIHEASFLIRIGRKAIDRLQDQIAVANSDTQTYAYSLQAEVSDIKNQCVEMMSKIEALDQCRQQNPVEMEDATSPKADPDEFELI